ncbi:MAG: hypothetical protein M2R45_03198 [Verrucomicrobia subdivision 3 bacterium]|nr:hypothetical protein [Limisphaerales bacterium]MCS1413913.1 hypothetical protein [Limisphaerales bacterium]
MVAFTEWWLAHSVLSLVECLWWQEVWLDSRVCIGERSDAYFEMLAVSISMDLNNGAESLRAVARWPWAESWE